MSLHQLVAKAAKSRPDLHLETPRQTYKRTMRRLALRWQAPDEIIGYDRELHHLVTATAPALISIAGVGVHTAAALLITAGDNPDRLRSEAAFAHLCGVATHPSLLRQDRPPPTQPCWR